MLNHHGPGPQDWTQPIGRIGLVGSDRPGSAMDVPMGAISGSEGPRGPTPEVRARLQNRQEAANPGE